MQVAALYVSEYLPFAQLMHVAELCPEYFPGVQSMQSVTTCVRDPPPQEGYPWPKKYLYSSTVNPYSEYFWDPRISFWGHESQGGVTRRFQRERTSLVHNRCSQKIRRSQACRDIFLRCTHQDAVSDSVKMQDAVLEYTGIEY